MKRGLTKKFAEEVYEYVRERDLSIDKFLSLDVRKIREIASELSHHSIEHYRRNLGVILEDIARAPGHKGLYFGFSPIHVKTKRTEREPYDLFLRKAVLYYDKIVCFDELNELLINPGFYKPKPLKYELVSHIARLGALRPWIEDGIVELLPFPDNWEGAGSVIDKLVKEDEGNEQWLELALQGGFKSKTAAIEELRFTLKELLGVSKMKDNQLHRLMIRGASRATINAVFASGFTGCSPIADEHWKWELLGFWLSCKADLASRGGLLNESQIKQMKNGGALLNLETKKLGFLKTLSHERIREIRISDEYRFNDFRRMWTDLCKELSQMPWEPSFGKMANQLWSEKIEPEAERVRKDLLSIKMRFGSSVLISSLGATTSLIPGFTFIGLFAALLPLLIPRISLFETMKKLQEIKKDEKNQVYFLLSAK